MPAAPASVIGVGVAAVGLSYLLPLPHSARVLLAAVACDRCLGEPPLSIHPVVLVGNTISAAVRRVPEQVFASPALGLLSGAALLLGVLTGALAGAWLVMSAGHAAAATAAVKLSTLMPAAIAAGAWLPGGAAVLPAGAAACLLEVPAAAAWLLEVLLFKSALSLQLLCTVAVQMAKLLERRRLPQAREQLSWLCSRNPSQLGSEELTGG